LKFSFETVGLDWKQFVKFDQRYERPTEVDALIGDFSRAEKILGWKPQTFAPELAVKMVNHEISVIEKLGS
jgi:GDPmannose 4,6-dehydratase